MKLKSNVLEPLGSGGGGGGSTISRSSSFSSARAMSNGSGLSNRGGGTGSGGAIGGGDGGSGGGGGSGIGQPRNGGTVQLNRERSHPDPLGAGGDDEPELTDDIDRALGGDVDGSAYGSADGSADGSGSGDEEQGGGSGAKGPDRDHDHGHDPRRRCWCCRRSQRDHSHTTTRQGTNWNPDFGVQGPISGHWVRATFFFLLPMSITTCAIVFAVLRQSYVETAVYGLGVLTWLFWRTTWSPAPPPDDLDAPDPRPARERYDDPGLDGNDAQTLLCLTTWFVALAIHTVDPKAYAYDTWSAEPLYDDDGDDDGGSGGWFRWSFNDDEATHGTLG